MDKILNELKGQHALVQILLRNGLGVEGHLLDFNDNWLWVKQNKGPGAGQITYVCITDITMMHRVSEVTVIGRQTNPLKIS